jgi:hypothetical protein
MVDNQSPETRNGSPAGEPPENSARESAREPATSPAADGTVRPSRGYPPGEISKKTSRTGLYLTTLALLTGLFTGFPGEAAAMCGCAHGGIPVIESARMTGNDLAVVHGRCAKPFGQVQIFVRQRFFSKRSTLEKPHKPLPTKCINNCEWLYVGETTADERGGFSLEDLDSSFSTQLITSRAGHGSEYGILTDIRTRSRDNNNGIWSRFTEPPELGSFRVVWNGEEGRTAFIETRVKNARWMHTSVADGPDDGDGLETVLDVDQDTPNFWLESHANNAVVAYTANTACSGPHSSSCRLGWLIQQAPTIYVNAPLLGRSAEFPFVLGMASAMRPGAMFLATYRSQDRDMADVLIHVDVDVDVDIDFGIDFLSIF